MEILKVKDLKIYFKTGGKELRAVDGVSFSLFDGEALGLVGESGCGKTTTALSIMRLLPQNGRIAQGEIIFQGEDLIKKSDKDIRKVRWKDISIIFQGAMNALNPVITVGEQIKEAILLHDQADENEARRRVKELFELVELDKKRVRQYPHEFSGGMRQRVMIAMALACRPKIIIGDEPTTALDVMVQSQVFELIGKLRAELGMSMILITHDLSVLSETCERAAVMYGGKILECGRIEELYSNPMNPYTSMLLSSFPDISKEKRMPSSIPGLPPGLINPPEGCRFHPRCPHALEICRKEEPAIEFITETHSYACHRGGAY
ncbi:MAG TPA: ABC transporter ATP-binding protein [Bacillota bacterium]|nr:ABC transporter ATP-binding protein [Bacillota bacterium]